MLFFFTRVVNQKEKYCFFSHFVCEVAELTINNYFLQEEEEGQTVLWQKV